MAEEQNNPFKNLPFPSPGDRIQADDFKRLSQSLNMIADLVRLSSSLFGRGFAEGKLALTTQQYAIEGVMSVFGTELSEIEDASLDDRKILQVLPVELGTRRVKLILTEAVETRRFTPNLMGLTHQEASEKLKSIMGDVTFPSGSFKVEEMVGLTLRDSKELIST